MKRILMMRFFSYTYCLYVCQSANLYFYDLKNLNLFPPVRLQVHSPLIPYIHNVNELQRNRRLSAVNCLEFSEFFLLNFFNFSLY
jgi:hypothetical protein